MSHVPRFSPWGNVDHSIRIAPGITIVETPSHGGWNLDDDHARRIAAMLPGVDSFLKTSVWWEEDCDWCIPCVAFIDEIEGQDNLKAGAIKSLRTFAECYKGSYATALELLQDKIDAYLASIVPAPSGWESVEA
jgi:hypothetical protein